MKERRKETREEQEGTNTKYAEDEPRESKKALCLNNRGPWVPLLHTGEGGGGAILRVEGRLSVHIAAPEDKIACTLGKQKDWPPSVQKLLRLVPNLI